MEWKEGAAMRKREKKQKLKSQAERRNMQQREQHCRQLAEELERQYII